MRRLILWWAMIGFALLYAPIAVSASARTLLVFGDSLSAGYGLPRDKAWVSLLADRLKRMDYTVANASLSGETTLGGLRRINGALAQHKPAIVLLALGGNDALRGQSIESIQKNLEAMVEACQKARAQVVLVGMRIPPNYGSSYANKFHTVYGDVARRYKLPLVPFLLDGFADKPEWFQADGIHPALRAQPAMLETVWPVLAPLLTHKNK